MAAIKKISGVDDVSSLNNNHYLLVESSEGTLAKTTVGAVVQLAAGGHVHNYAGSSSAGGPANDFTAGAGSDDADRYVYFAYNDSTYNNPSVSSVNKGRAVVDSDFKYNPATNKLSTGSIQLNSKVTLQYNSSTESLDFVFT